MNIEIMSGAALDTAEDIANVVKSIDTDMQKLDEIFTKTAPSMRLDWADAARDEWQSFYNADVPESMKEMLKSAENLQTAVKAAAEASRGQ